MARRRRLECRSQYWPLDWPLDFKWSAAPDPEVRIAGPHQVLAEIKAATPTTDAAAFKPGEIRAKIGVADERRVGEPRELWAGIRAELLQMRTAGLLHLAEILHIFFAVGNTRWQQIY